MPRPSMVPLIAWAALILIVLVVALTSCSPHKVTMVYPKPAVVNPEFTYRQDSEETFTIYVPATTPHGEVQAKEDLCSTAFVCSWMVGGKILFLERIRK